MQRTDSQTYHVHNCGALFRVYYKYLCLRYITIILIDIKYLRINIRAYHVRVLYLLCVFSAPTFCGEERYGDTICMHHLMYIGPIKMLSQLIFTLLKRMPVRFACAMKLAFPADADDLTGLCVLPSFENIFAGSRFLLGESRACIRTAYKKFITLCDWHM